MNHFFQSLRNDSSLVQAFIFAATLLVCWNIENLFGLLTVYNKWKHAFLNAGFIFTNLPVQFLMGLAFAFTIKWTALHHFGIIYRVYFFNNSFFVFVIVFIVLDLGEYVYHILMHKIKRFWMFHVVHHSDPIVDVSTSLREHPGENFIRNSFTLLWVFLSGATFWMLLLRQLIQTSSNVFSHINYRLPEKLDRLIGYLFITPNLHHVHHHYKQPYTDCNYGDVLSIWDRMFNTFKKLPAEKLKFGADAYKRKEDTDNFMAVFKIPFGKYRKTKRDLNS
ncbi:MAG TPA: sterol desaturase family protein [Chitinophagaceae bacterium]|nr:sterol desaturase family protein [Chitinophagaceae bacterium]